jgi:hypothetical protein
VYAIEEYAAEDGVSHRPAGHAAIDRTDQAGSEKKIIRRASSYLDAYRGENQIMTASRPFRSTQIELLEDPANAALYLEEALVAGDTAAFKLALRNVAEPASVG